MSRSVPYSANPLLQIRLPAYRSRLLMFLVAVGFLALICRAVWLQVFRQDFLQRQGESRYSRTVELPASRGKVMDRNGMVLASSLPARAVWASPEEIKATPAQIAELGRLLQMSPAEIQKKLDSGGSRTFVYLKRQVEAPVAAQIAALGIAGVHQRNEYKRFYPEGETLAHVVGFTNVEDIGQEGIELSREQELAGRPGSRWVLRDNFKRAIEGETLREPVDGQDLQLSIDAKVQFHAYAALREAVREHRAKAGAVVVIDVRTGEVLALANLPTYNPNERGQLSGAQLRNRVITDTFEPGSTMKVFTTALALESGRFSSQSMIQTAPGKLTIGNATIGDVHAYGALSVEQVLQKSSNVGTAKIALSFPPERMWNLYTAVGFGQAPDLGFPGAVAGRLRPHRSWRPIEHATMSYGHGVSVSLIQLARAYTVFARDGDLVPLSMLRNDEPAAGVRVIDPKTAREVRRILELAAGPGGTAPKAQIAGYRVGGKTGTAHKQEGGRYVNKYIANFVGFAPASDPRVVIAVMIDEPSAGKHYGGEVAAPVFAKIAGDTMRALRVPPDAPMASLSVPPGAARENM